MEILVTGAAGFIGSNYVRLLLETTDATITSVDALTYAGDRSKLPDHDRLQFVQGNITDRELAADLVAAADQIVNFAAESHVDRSIDGASSFVRSNVEGVATLLDACVDHGIDQFVQISTDEVYGEIPQGKFHEGDKLTPRNPYAATKAGADLLAHSYHVTHDVPVVITRSSNNYGPRQHTEKLIPKLIRRASAGEPLPIYGDGSNVREWTYVVDNCRAVERVRSEGTPGETYNIGSGVERTNLEIAEAVCDTVGADRDLIEFVEDRPGHDQRYAVDTTRIGKLDWEPTVPFSEGLQRTVEFYLK
jgi:dTDP-glucose 4,6-dehydratase